MMGYNEVKIIPIIPPGQGYTWSNIFFGSQPKTKTLH